MGALLLQTKASRAASWWGPLPAPDMGTFPWETLLWWLSRMWIARPALVTIMERKQ